MTSFRVLVAFAVFVTAQAALDKERILPLLQKCKEEIGAVEDPVEILSKAQIPDSYKGKCMVACYLEKEGVMQNGQMDSSKYEQLVEQVYNKELAEPIIAAHRKCFPETKETDKCEFIASHVKCIKKEGASFT